MMTGCQVSVRQIRHRFSPCARRLRVLPASATAALAGASLAIEQPDYQLHPPSFAPSLAASWDQSEDGLSLTFHLRDDAPRGLLLWNVPGAADWARALVRAGRPMSRDERAASVPWAGPPPSVG